MSHFAAAVILKDINDLEKALAPYQENNMGDCPKEYLEFYSTRKEKEEEYETYTRTMYRDEYGGLYSRNHTIFEKIINYEERDKYSNYHIKDNKCYTYDYEGYKKVEIPYKVIWENVEEYLKEYCSDEWDEEAQDYGYWENPNKKWDYWVLCAKNNFARYINPKMPLGYCKLKDLDKSLNEDKYKKALREWELIVEEQPLKEGEYKPFTFYKKEYYIKRYATKEEYATIMATPHYFAFVLEGKWYEKGEMFMFGASEVTKTSEALYLETSEALYLEKWKEVINNPKYQDYYIAVVDCHI